MLVAARPHNSLIWFAVNGVNYVNDAVKNHFLNGSVHKQFTQKVSFMLLKDFNGVCFTWSEEDGWIEGGATR